MELPEVRIEAIEDDRALPESAFLHFSCQYQNTDVQALFEQYVNRPGKERLHWTQEYSP
jgi:hypothetical protein